jgi:sRNA-binding protein
MNETTCLLKTSDLKKLYPEVFKSIKPLKIGIYHDLIAIHGEQNKKIIRATLGFWTQHANYLFAVAAGGFRYALDGTTCGEISAVEIEDAKNKLDKIHSAQVKENAEKKYRSQLLKSFESSGLTRYEFAQKNSMTETDVSSALDKATNERKARMEQRQKIVNKLEKSGLSVEEFAEHSKYSLHAIKKAVTKLKKDVT